MDDPIKKLGMLAFSEMLHILAEEPDQLTDLECEDVVTKAISKVLSSNSDLEDQVAIELSEPDLDLSSDEFAKLIIRSICIKE